MRTRLLAILLPLIACVLLALGVPLADSKARAEQQHLVIDRIDDTARFAATAQNAGAALTGSGAREATASERAHRVRLGAELARYHEVYGIRAGVFDRSGRALAAAPAGYRIPAEARQAFAEALDGRRSHDPPQVWPWWGGGHRIQVASPVVRDGDVVAVTLTDSPSDRLRARILAGWLPLAVGESAALLVALLLAHRLAGWVLRPVRVLDRTAHDIATGRMASRVAPAGGPPELRRLAGSFNHMADAVEAAVEQQRAFVADASHQLRNPLAALLLRIESLGLELPPGTEEELDGVRGEGRRLARVLDDLLGLAQAEHSRPERGLVDVAELLRERVDAWRPLADREDVRLALTGPRAATAHTDPIGLGSALDALLDNAVKFAAPQGAGASVDVDLALHGPELAVTITDNGPGLEPEELARIGDRFWRSPRHQNTDGSGLGLSIARALLASAGARLDFARAPGGGLAATVTVPRIPPEGTDPAAAASAG
ncbi:histidine kinase [Mangrovactinospora gilvigrisea]|uniref:histidine kinase n=1 Tax=Mangrovactinospora gilvigrisea TaxID=1428644 RepID=A0A1J7C9Y3_9ACTN|nr:HAMP domain-containing sensor histidine kinase [Mangrovactinospora gilvigrisea]OIV36458.1 histidine kinase [Mangrovactinospora gilvigrisea]